MGVDKLAETAGEFEKPRIPNLDLKCGLDGCLRVFASALCRIKAVSV